MADERDSKALQTASSAATALFDVSLLISRYCAFKDNYEEISTDDLIAIIEKHKEKLFYFEMTQ